MTTLRALLVEDDDLDATLFQQCVHDLRGPDRLTFARVDHLAAAIAHLQAVEVDVVLLDLGLPDSQGLETFHRLRAAAPDTPVVVLTGTLDDKAARAAVDVGAQDFIGKDELLHVPLSRVLRYAVERHRMQAQLAASEARFRTLVELADDALARVVLEPGPRLEYISPAIEGITGLTPDELRADPRLFTDRVHPDDSAAWQDRSQLATGTSTCVVYRWQRADGDWAWLEDRRTPLLEHGELVAYQSVTRDVTALKQAEAVLQTALEQERAAVEKLRSLDEMKTTFLQAVSHELRTPLTVIRGFALTLQGHGDELPRDQRVILVDRLVAASARLQRLLADLLDVDRLDRGLVAAERRPTDVGRLVRDALEELDAPGHPLSVVCQEGLVVAVDAAKVERIVENLVMNAVKHTPTGTPVYVVTEGDEHGVVLTVADQGPGIPPEERERLFEPFAQGALASSAASPGTGIGLSLVAQFAELHGGSARIEETRGGGATFVVELPAAAGAGTAEHGPVNGAALDGHPVVAATLRRFQGAATSDEVTGALLVAVERLGGSTRAGDASGPDVLPLDLSLGSGRPLLPAAPAGSDARTMLETHLPRLLEDARLAVGRCRAVPSVDPATPPGFESRAVLRDLLGQLAPGDAFIQLEFAGRRDETWGHVETAAAVTRSCIRVFDRAVLVDPWTFVVVLPHAGPVSVEVSMARLRTAFTLRLPDVGVRMDVTTVGPGGGVAAYRKLSERVDA